jgi:acyl-CoA dehydrogenase
MRRDLFTEDHSLPQERPTVAVGSVAQARSASAAAIDYTKDRKAFGTPVASFQNTKFELAACSTEVEAGQAMLDRAVTPHVEGELSAAARVKLFAPRCRLALWIAACNSSAATVT